MSVAMANEYCARLSSLFSWCWNSRSVMSSIFFMQRNVAQAMYRRLERHRPMSAIESIGNAWECVASYGASHPRPYERFGEWCISSSFFASSRRRS